MKWTGKFVSQAIVLALVCVQVLQNHVCYGMSYISISDDETNYISNLGRILESDVDDLIIRRRRSAPSETISNNSNLKITESNAGNEPVITQYALNNSHHQIMVDWAGAGSKVVVCVSKDIDQNVNSTTNVYISYDYGTTFQDKSDAFKIKDKQGIIYKFYKNEKFMDRFIFADLVNKYLFVTNDYGHTIYPRELQFSPSEISIHPSNSLIFLIMDRDDTMKKLWITTDFGETFKVLSLYVKTYFWSDSDSGKTLYVEREEPGNENTVIAFKSFSGENFNYRVVTEGVQNFILKENFLFAVKKKPHLLGSHIPYEDGLQLWISYKEGPFLLAEFPNNLTHQNYYIADVAEGQIMVCVFHEISSNLYVSSIPRSSEDQIKFSLSLERIFYYNPNTNWNNTWLNKKSDEAFADLHRVKGVRGVFIASQLLPNYTKMARRLGPEHIISLITFDQGGEWKPLTPPKVDDNGKSIDCFMKEGCSLHISQELSKLYPETQTKPILSVDSAPGLILSSGTVGTSLKGHIGVYLSTDAGVNWYHILKGNYLFTFGDHGGIMMAVQHFRSNGETDEVLFSIDEGETWQSHTFYSEKIRVYGLMTEPGENTTIFTLFGSKLAKHEWIIVKIDMSPIFQKKCSGKDFKSWIPFDSMSGRYCLLGQREVYQRRAPHSYCNYGVDYDRPVTVERCPCERDDYECDFGFIPQSNQSSECVRDKSDIVNPLTIPLSCKEGEFYNRTKGYRKVPGDYCLGGEEAKYEADLTPCPLKEEKEFLLVSNRKSILRYDLLNPSDGLQPLPISDLNVVIALDFHLKNNCLYWSESTEKKIMRQCFDGEHRKETIVEDHVMSVEGLALDWVSLNLYFTDGETKTVELVSIKAPNPGRIRKTLLKEPAVDLPRGIAVHPVRGLMFLTDWSEVKPMVASANLDGTNLKVLFGNTEVGWPNGITIDIPAEKIYWADAKMDYIASSDLDGKNFLKVVSESEHVKQPFAVGVYKSMLYWDDWSTLQIMQTDKEHRLSIVPLNDKPMSGLVDLKVFGHWSQTGSNSCGDSSINKCQFFCVGTPDNGYNCLCPSWLKPVKEGDHNKCVCADGSDPTESGACKSVDSNCSGGDFKCDNGFCIPKNMLCDMDNDCGDSSDEKYCGHSSCEASSWQCKNGHCISPAWKCDADNDCGDNSDEENCTYVACSQDDFTCNNKRCIDKRWLCDLQDDCRDGSDEANCTVPHINKGSCNTFQFQCNSSGTCLPISWRCDGEKDCSDMSDEHNCEAHKCGPYQYQCSSKRCIYKSWVCDGDSDCEDGGDEANCTSSDKTTLSPIPSPLPPFFPKNNNTCSSFEFRCTNGNCIPFWWRCDNAFDCPDGSDEVGCIDGDGMIPDKPLSTTTKAPQTYACRQDQMECSNGECIWEAWVCDGTKDCTNGEDEENCNDKTYCTGEQFRCWHTEGCIESKLRCNGVSDCADGSDEMSCHHNSTNTTDPTMNCTDGFFSCDGGNCLPDSKKCDKNIDCIDMSDEKSCTTNGSKIYQVNNLRKSLETNISLTFAWNFSSGVNNTGGFEFMPSRIIKEALGNSNAWKNGTWTDKKMYTFDHLDPFTTYILKVYVMETATKKVFVPAELLTMSTSEGIPSPPTNIAVTQDDDKLLIVWEHPHHPNGAIISYKVYISPPEPAKHIEVGGDTFKLFYIPPKLQENFTIKMTCSNSKFSSDYSEQVAFEPSSVDSEITGLKVKSQNASEIVLMWNPISDIEGYIVNYAYPENEFLDSKITKNVTVPEIKLNKIAPGLKYVFKVQGFKGYARGPVSTLEVESEGQRLPKLFNLRQELLKSPGTSVKVFWEPPPYKQKYIWEYEIVWGKTVNELRQKTNAVKTQNTSFIISNLDACEEYYFLTMITGPIGEGPAIKFEITTREDSLAPPKNVGVKPQDKYMEISWMSPCPYVNDNNLHYLINITETYFNKQYYFNVPTKNVSFQSHRIEMKYGARYKITVRTFLNDSRESKPVFINGPAIPSPYELTYNPSDVSFYWRDNKNIPTELLKQNHSYVLYLVRSDNNSTKVDIELDAKQPPYHATQLDPGQIYYASVAFKNQFGYLSERSQTIRVEKPVGDAIVVTETSVVGVAISVVSVIFILIAVVVVLAVRHKRLARSFSAFANSHYDRSEGTTHITTEHNLDEDDSPMIRGFSDDEPLVIA